MRLTSVWRAKGVRVAGLSVGLVALVVGAALYQRHATHAHHGKSRWGWTGLYAWTPIPERMRSKEIAGIFSVVPYTGDLQPRLAQIDQIEAQHKGDQDIAVLSSYVRTTLYWMTLYWSLRTTPPDDLQNARKAATELLERAQRDPGRYRHFQKCARHLLASFEMLEAPRSVDRAKGRLADLLKADPNTDAAEFSISSAAALLQDRDGREACFPFLQQLAQAHPATLTAFWCWNFIALLHAQSGDLKQATSDWEQQLRVAEQIGDERLVEAARGAIQIAQAREAAGPAKGKAP